MQPPSDRDSYLPPLARRRRSRDWGRLFARFMCVLFALVGTLPVVLGLVVRSEWLRGIALRETSRLLAAQGISATYKVEVSLLPVSVSVVALQVESSDGGPPLVTADRVAVRPKFFALLSGKLAIDQIEVDSPRVRLIVKDGQIQNLAFKIPKSTTKDHAPFHAPFNVVAVTDADVDLDVDGTHVVAQDIDVDVTVDDDPRLGSSFEIGANVGGTRVRRARTIAATAETAERVAVDDDVLCTLEGRVRVEPQAILVRRFTATGAADADESEETTPSCDLPPDDERRVEVALAHVRVDLPENAGELPKRAGGHVRARAPLPILARFVKIDGLAGWVSVDVDVRHDRDTQIPDVSGKITGRGLKLTQFSLAKELESDIVIRKNVVTSPRTVVKIADGTATLTDTVVEPLAKGIPLKTSLDARDLSFASLMRDLGVSDHAHVQWDVHELKATPLTGTLNPLKLDGDLTLVTGTFAVFDKAVDDATHSRLVGFRDVSVTSRVGIRAAALEFRNVRAVLPKSTLEQGFCSIGFHNDLIVDVPKGHIDMDDLTPIAAVQMHGVADIEAHLAGAMDNPLLTAKGSVANYVLGDIPFGDVTRLEATYSGTVVDLKNVSVKKGKSQYDVKAARLDFGAGAGVLVDASASSEALGLKDFFAIFKMEEDPRFEAFNAEIAMRATVHVALGGTEDVCGDGYIEVRAAAKLKKIEAFGETFDDGDVNLVYRWTDRAAGIEGADIELRSLVVHKAVTQGGKRTLGTILGSATVQRGGALAGGVVLESIPLGRLQSLGAFAKQVDGSVSGFARVSGKVSSIKLESELDITPIHLQGVPFGASRAHVTMTQAASTSKPIGKTKCGGDVFADFDKEAYLREPTSKQLFVVDGELLGGQLRLDGVSIEQSKSAAIKGQIGMRGLDIGALARVASPKKRDLAAGDDSAPEAPLKGELSGDLVIADFRTDDLAHANVRFAPTAMFVERDGQRISLRPEQTVLKFSHDTLTIPDLNFEIRTQGGLSASFAVGGSVIHASQNPELSVDLKLAPVDLALLSGVVPRLETASGKLEGSVHISGRANDPDVDGQLHLHGGEFAIRGSPSALSEVELDVQANASEVRVTKGTAKFGGGTVEIRRASIPFRDLTFGAAEAEVTVEDLPIAWVDGVTGTVGANLLVSYKPSALGVAGLPKVSGDVTLTSLEYTRPVNLVRDLTAFGAKSLGVRSTRTVVETYDPSLDAVAFDLHVRSRTPLRIRNNLVEAQLRIDSNAINVTGTNQRFGLRGDLRTVAGGRFHFRNSDFEVRQGVIRFDDPTRIAPKVDVIATTEYRRYQDSSSKTGTSSGTSGFWRITLHAYGDADDLRLEMTSEPALSQEDIVLLLSIGMTRAEVDQIQAGSLGAGLALEALATVSGADRALKAAVPVIDDFRFGSAYSPRAGRTVPQVSVGKRLTDNVRATVTTGITSEDRELRSNIEWRLGQRSSVLGSYDNIYSISNSPVGNVGIDFRWRLEFE